MSTSIRQLYAKMATNLRTHTPIWQLPDEMAQRNITFRFRDSRSILGRIWGDTIGIKLVLLPVIKDQAGVEYIIFFFLLGTYIYM